MPNNGIFAFRKDLIEYLGQFVRDSKITGRIDESFKLLAIETNDFYWCYVDEDSDFLKALIEEGESKSMTFSKPKNRNTDNKDKVSTLGSYKFVSPSGVTPLRNKYKSIIRESLRDKDVVFISAD